MTAFKPDVSSLVNEMPDADSPGRTSKFTGPPPEVGETIVTRILEGGRESLLELIGMIRDANGHGEKNYKPGYVLHSIAAYVGRAGQESQRKMFAETLASKLGGASPSKDVQGFLVRQLQVAGGPEVVPALGELLSDEELCDYASHALVAIGGGAAALMKAFPRAKGRNRVAIVQALGTVGDAKCTALLKKVADDEDPHVRTAAVWALASNGDVDGARTVVQSADKATGWERIKMTQACLLLAEKLVKAGKETPARRIYTHLRDSRSQPAENYIKEAARKALEG